MKYKSTKQIRKAENIKETIKLVLGGLVGFIVFYVWLILIACL